MNLMGVSGSFSLALVACALRTSSPLAHDARLNVCVCASPTLVLRCSWMCAAQLHAMICKTNSIPIVAVHFIEFFIINCKRRATLNTTTRSAKSNCTLLHFYERKKLVHTRLKLFGIFVARLRAFVWPFITRAFYNAPRSHRISHLDRR